MPKDTRFKIFFLGLFSLIITACSYNFLPDDDFFESDVSASFTEVLDSISKDDISALSKIAVSEFREIENFEESMRELLDVVGDPRESKLILAENRRVDTSKDAEKVFYAAYEYENENKYEVLQIALQEVDGECCFLRHIQFNQDDFQRSSYNDFGTHDLSLKRLLFLALMIFTLLLIFFVIILIIRDKHQKRKWLWIIFALFGTYGATLNWTTAEISPNFMSFREGGRFYFSLIKFNLFGGGFSRSGLFQPWVLDWGLPLGAIIYLIKRWRRKSPASIDRPET